MPRLDMPLLGIDNESELEFDALESSNWNGNEIDAVDECRGEFRGECISEGDRIGV